MSPPVQVRAVRDGRGRRAFLELPLRLYRRDRNWVPPLLAAQAKLLAGRTAFFDPETWMVPARRVPPWMTNLSIGTSSHGGLTATAAVLTTAPSTQMHRRPWIPPRRLRRQPRRDRSL